MAKYKYYLKKFSLVNILFKVYFNYNQLQLNNQRIKTGQ